MIQCKFCEEEVTQSHKGRPKLYCNEKCRQKWRYRNDPCIRDRDVTGEQKRRGYKNKWEAIQQKGGSCQLCGESRPSVLTFHHRDPSEKGFALDTRSFANTSKSRVKEEVEKCDLLCHNCHMHLHRNEGWEVFFSKRV